MKNKKFRLTEVINGVLKKRDIYLIIGFFTFVLVILLFTFFSPNYYSLKEPVTFEIKKGESLDSIIDSLYSKNIIPSKFNMKVASLLYGAERKIKAGRYLIPNGLSYIKLVELFVDGKFEIPVTVDFYDGISLNGMAAILTKRLGIDSTEFINLATDKSFSRTLGVDNSNLLGYLLPGKYEFYKDVKIEDIFRVLKKAMDSIFTEELQFKMHDLAMDKHQILTLASIIEAESNYISEYATISGVYHNRLNIGMKLQADPTIQFLIRREGRSRVLYKDFAIDSPFNTYKYEGLPPSPINNPGKDAIQAAIMPEMHKFFYFVADGNGKHNFSKTYEEHLRSVRKYREWLRSRQ